MLNSFIHQFHSLAAMGVWLLASMTKSFLKPSKCTESWSAYRSIILTYCTWISGNAAQTAQPASQGPVANTYIATGLVQCARSHLLNVIPTLLKRRLQVAPLLVPQLVLDLGLLQRAGTF